MYSEPMFLVTGLCNLQGNVQGPQTFTYAIFVETIQHENLKSFTFPHMIEEKIVLSLVIVFVWSGC